VHMVPNTGLVPVGTTISSALRKKGEGRVVHVVAQSEGGLFATGGEEGQVRGAL